MIWYERQIGDTIIRGIFNPPGSTRNLIEILIEWDGNTRLIYATNPALGRYTEPVADDILAKYVHIIKRAETSIEELKKTSPVFSVGSPPLSDVPGSL